MARTMAPIQSETLTPRFAVRTPIAESRRPQETLTPLQAFALVVAQSTTRRFLLETLMEAKRLTGDTYQHHEWANLEASLFMNNREEPFAKLSEASEGSVGTGDKRSLGSRDTGANSANIG